ncbi:MAG: type II toxin-antitoxin system RelE/ParE family toxin [Actinomycetota bacterium]|nr:type II toxin-antitoxin system RelE/ParE family toxin [Actinomycetota bacterium]
MAMMHTVFYRDDQGHEPVDEFIDRLRPVEAQVAIDHQIDRLNMLRTTDPPLAFPHSSQIEGELRELRCHYGRRLVRVLYRRSGNLFVLLHAFEKRSRLVSEEDKAVARARWGDFRARMDAQPRRPPRAAGHDAP